MVQLRLTHENLEKAFPDVEEVNHYKPKLLDEQAHESEDGFSSHASSTSQNGAVKRYLDFDLPEEAQNYVPPGGSPDNGKKQL